MHHRHPLSELPLISPPPLPAAVYDDAVAAVADLRRRYEAATGFLREKFGEVMAGAPPEGRYRAFYPAVGLTTASFAKVDSRLSFGHVTEPGIYETTVTRPELFEGYLTEQIGLLIQNHGMPVRVGTSDTPIPLHFAMGEDAHVEGAIAVTLHRPLRDLFDVPDLNTTDDHIVNGTVRPGAARPLAPFTAQRIDYSLARLAHYTATSPSHFQNHVLFTNYQFYMDEFVDFALEAIADPTSGYTAFVEPGNAIVTRDGRTGAPIGRSPQMPAFHLIRPRHSGISMVNIGVGPSNAKTATDHLAVLRPHCWLMIGHCGGLRQSQTIGDYVLAHGYLRRDRILDDLVPTEIPVPALAEVQLALQEAAARVTGERGGDALKRRLRTGTVVSYDDRNWELRWSQERHRISLGRCIAVDMESAALATQGYRLRVPYGTLLCVSDKPLHGEIKLPGAATRFYERAVGEHLRIGLEALALLRGELGSLHSRKLRGFDEPPFR